MTMIIACLISFAVAVVVGGKVILPALRRLKAGQSIREEGPQSHQVKSGTPTMGGLAILLGIVLTCLTSGVFNADMMILLGTLLAFGVIGFIDDFVKVAMKSSVRDNSVMCYVGAVSEITTKSGQGRSGAYEFHVGGGYHQFFRTDINQKVSFAVYGFYAY